MLNEGMMKMLFKSLGINGEEIEKYVKACATAAAEIVETNRRLEEKVDLILAKEGITYERSTQPKPTDTKQLTNTGN